MLVLVPYVAPVATLLNLVAMLFDIPVNHRLFCLATIAAGNSWIPTTCWEVVPYAVEYGRLLRSPIGKPLPKDWQPSWFIGIVLGLFVATGIPKQHPLYTFLSPYLYLQLLLRRHQSYPDVRTGGCGRGNGWLATCSRVAGNPLRNSVDS